MTKNDKINAIKPLKGRFNALNKQFDRILRYSETTNENITDEQYVKIVSIRANMGVIFNEISMIMAVPMAEKPIK